MNHPQYNTDFHRTAISLELARLDQLHSPSFTQFMFTLNAFVLENRLRPMFNWSKVWEYSWIWFNCLSKQDWQVSTSSI